MDGYVLLTYFLQTLNQLTDVVLRKAENKPSLMTPVVHVFFSSPRKGMLASYGENFLELGADFLPRVTESSGSSALAEQVNTQLCQGHRDLDGLCSLELLHQIYSWGKAVYFCFAAFSC